jgi:tetratricopeptide (TPR) repeat protein/V8-like Glu-specific endopeptidase
VSTDDRFSWLAWGVGISVALVQPAVLAKSATEVNDIAQAISVKISTTNGNGSGILLQKQGDVYTILTAAHVVKNERASYTITTPDGRTYQPIANSIRRYQGDVDLAVLKFRSSATYKLAELGDSNVLKGGMNIYVAGFPAPTKVITESVFVFREGKVSANSKRAFKDGYSLLYSNNTLSGMSGGPVLNEAGQVVGIHGKGDRDQGIKTEFNAGIPIARFADIASGLGVETRTSLARTVQSSTLTADDYFVSANQKYGQGNYQGALTDYNQAITLNPNYAFAYHNRGNLKYQKLNDPQGALADYNRAIALNPNLAEAYAGRGLLKFEKLNDYQGALADYNRAIALNPNLAEAYGNRGNLKYQKLNDYQGALADYNRVIATNPNLAEAYHNRGSLKYQKLNDLSGALQDFSYVIKLNPQLDGGYYNRGDLLYIAGRKAEALQDFRKVRNIAPAGLYGLIATGIIAMEGGQLTSAITNFNKAIIANPSSGDAFKYRGLAYRQQGNATQAIQDWRKAAQFYKNDNYARDYQIIRGWLKELGVNI